MDLETTTTTTAAAVTMSDEIDAVTTGTASSPSSMVADMISVVTAAVTTTKGTTKSPLLSLIFSNNNSNSSLWPSPTTTTTEAPSAATITAKTMAAANAIGGSQQFILSTNLTNMLRDSVTGATQQIASHQSQPQSEYRQYQPGEEDGNVLVECWNRDHFAILSGDLHKLPTPMIILLVIAFLVVFWMGVKFVQALWTYFICYMLGFGAKWRPGPDSWAIITGSTDGIGLAYAKAMAKKGYCLFLLSRTQQKLDKVKAEVLNEFPDCPQVRVMAVDFTKDTIYKQIDDEIRALGGHVHVLVNNVGMSYKYPEYFTKIINADKFITDILNCNIVSVTRMTHIVLPLMEARRSGIIINISSYSALFPTPLLAMYSASKIYMDYFSRALHSEYCERGIVVQSVLPYYVSTNMIRNPGISLMIPSPDQFVASALKTVGVETRTYGYFAHNILAFFQSFIIKFVIGNNLNTKIAFARMKRFRKGCYKRKGLKHNV